MASLKYYKITLKRYVYMVTRCNLSRYHITLLYIIVICGGITRIMLLHNITDDRVADPQLKLFDQKFLRGWGILKSIFL